MSCSEWRRRRSFAERYRLNPFGAAVWNLTEEQLYLDELTMLEEIGKPRKRKSYESSEVISFRPELTEEMENE